ncbi:hypothetical protein [Mediterraneibacter glycyrrhizinilyticus]|uniref:hypothetical protein n=1 Tax=Mediterraneibacter glycyrrhizinilyticus TaxID=342942 RepID=UPI0025A42CE3|nr:hypothetical protein [Mediterraneibacter glycyrrhizinilyticus]MDM8126627.1 hypothetical protein [Mediterraneibacter glycyrrhizinilyticus]
MNEDNLNIKCELISDDEFIGSSEFDFDKIIFDLNSQIDLLSSQADSLDYIVAIASGIVCGILDILWVGEFDLAHGRSIASDKVDSFVKNTAEMLEGKTFDDVKSAVQALEKHFPIPSDGNTSDFGGGKQHHLRDFAHHPTIVGLVFSLLTQFTEKSYGTDVNGRFITVDVLEKSKPFIGKDIPEKILMGTIIWFFHLVSDMARSSSTAGTTGGTGIPGPLLALAKEVSAIPFFKNIKVDDDMSMSLFLSKLFNGTLMMKRDEKGQIVKDSIIKFDLRGELGVAVELCKQAVPVVANECFVRAFYFIRHLAMEMKENRVGCFADMKMIDWDTVKPLNNPTIARMLTISTGVFTVLDIGEAIATQKYWVSINYVGIGRFAVAISSDVSWGLKVRDVKKIRGVYENIKHQTFGKTDANIYKRIGDDMDLQMDKLGLSLEQTEMLYNLEYYKTFNDIEMTKLPVTGEVIKELKSEWLKEWSKFISNGFESFTQISGAEMHWYSIDELQERIAANDPQKPWYRLILLEAMLFEPYYPLGTEKDKKGNDIPSKKYKHLNNPLCSFRKGEGDRFLDEQFTGKYCKQGYVKRLRKSYDKRMRELSEVLKTVLTSLTITAVIAIITVASAGAFAGPIAVALVGSNFAGLSGAALTSACLAYLGGGAIAAGGAGMLGGTIAIVGGGAALGIGVGAGVGGAVGSAGLVGKKNTIMQSAKLLTSVREIFLNDEHDIEFSNSVYEQYLQNITEIEKGLVELRLKMDVAKGKEKKEIAETIKKAEESVEVMKVARKNMLRFNSSFAEGLQTQQ